jgi:hypothetical protein
MRRANFFALSADRAAVSSAVWRTLLRARSVGAPDDRFGSRDMLRVVGLL